MKCVFDVELKAKSHELFYIWVTKLQAHRSYRKSEAATAAAATAATAAAWHGVIHNGHVPTLTQTSAKAAVNNKVSAWLQQSPAPDTCAQGRHECTLA